MKQTFLLQEVIDDLVNTDKSLSSPLMKLNYFSKLIKNQELIDYTQNELNGYYQTPDKIPDYRKAKGNLFIDLQANIHQHFGKELPVSMLEEKYHELFKYVNIKEGISIVEKLAKEAIDNNSDTHYSIAFPIEMLFILQEPASKFYKSDVRIQVIGARMMTNVSAVIAIPNAIRTKLLDLVMSIADNFGYNIEIESFNKKAEINNQTIINQMNTTINNSGDGNIINTGNENQIESNVTLYKGDTERLNKELLKQGIEQEDIQELLELVKNENPNQENGRLGEKSNGWISKIINKSLNGVGRIATGISANILATLIRQYYGMP
ncbi:MAG: hypothetical protein ACOYLE_01730 [Bacteroidales bacterium]